MTRKLGVLLAVLALGLFGLAACGGDDDDAVPEAPDVEAPDVEAPDVDDVPGVNGETVEISSPADGALEYDQDNVTTEAGDVTVEYENPSSVPHDVRVESQDGEDLGGTEVITDGSDSATIDLEPGTYTFYCSVPGHREGGMEGTLNVE